MIIRHISILSISRFEHAIKHHLRASIGALIGIGFTGSISALAFGTDPRLPLIVAPMGASAVLLFTAPASPFAQPWAIIGGNTISALVGVAVGQWIREPMVAVGVAVSVAIMAMSLARCLHPPGGAAALTAIIGGPSVIAAGFAFPIIPVCLNAVLLVLLGIVYHRFSGHPYPHVHPVLLQSGGLLAEDKAVELPIESAPMQIRQAEKGSDSASVSHRSLTCPAVLNGLSCRDVASQNIVPIAPDDSVETARALLLEHGLNALLVADSSGYLVGVVGPPELARDAEYVSEIMATPVWLDFDAPMLDLVPLFMGGHATSVVITDHQGCIFGIVTPLDILKKTPQTRCDAADQIRQLRSRG